MDDDAALAQILAANDELTLVVNAYKDRVGKRECNGGRERSRSEEEKEDKNNGRPLFCTLFFSVSPCGKHFGLVFGSALCCLYLILFSLVPPAPTSPREIKSYHLIDLSALDSPQTHRKADSPLSFESSSPMFSSPLKNAFHSMAEQNLNEIGKPAFVPISSLFSLTAMIHNVMMFCPVITELDNLVSKQTQETSRSYYEDLLQVRLGCKVKINKADFIWKSVSHSLSSSVSLMEMFR